MASITEEIKLDPLMTNILLMIHRTQRSIRPVEMKNELRAGSRLYPTLDKMMKSGLIEQTVKKRKLSAYGLTETGKKVAEKLLPNHEDIQDVKEDVEKDEDDFMLVFFDSYFREKYGRPDKNRTVKNALRVRSEVQILAKEFLMRKGFVEIAPVIISPITDPLRYTTYETRIPYCKQTYRLTQSMIFHKQVAICSFEKIFTFSPNVRLESPDLADTGRHLVEFTQLDLEVRDATRSDMIELGEQLFIYILTHVKKNCKEEMEFFRRNPNLKIPKKTGFDQFTYEKQKEKRGSDFPTLLSHERDKPFWIIDFPINSREFYDRENPIKHDLLVDMDLILPEGYGEVLSGGEREYTYDRLLERLRRSQLRISEYRLYLLIAKRGLKPSAGFGLGLERLVSYICGLRHIDETTFFPKIPGDIFSL